MMTTADVFVYVRKLVWTIQISTQIITFLPFLLLSYYLISLLSSLLLCLPLLLSFLILLFLILLQLFLPLLCLLVTHLFFFLPQLHFPQELISIEH